jgi:C-terminal processing protease CtpA/Prc
MRLYSFFIAIVLFVGLLSFESNAQTVINISFKVIVPKYKLKGLKSLEIRGSGEPLSWEKPTLLTKVNDSVFATEIYFKPSIRAIEFKYLINGKDWEELAYNHIASVNNGISVIDRFGTQGTYYPEQFQFIPKSALTADLSLIAKAVPELHAGFDRYTNQKEFTDKVSEAMKNLPNLLTDAQVYLAISEVMATLQCGHTYANFYNQNAVTHHLVFDRPDKLPFTLHITDKQIYIVKNVSNLKGIEPGSEILSVNGVPAAEIIAKLLTLVKADGDNNGKRLSDLQVTGMGKYEAFDIYFPLLFPAKKGNKYTLQILPFKSTSNLEIDVTTISRQERKDLLFRKYNTKDLPADSLFQFKIINEGKTAYLKLGTFVDYNLKLDWKKFLANAFKIIEKKKISSLIIDIRDNEGGTDNILYELLTYLANKPLQLEKSMSLVRYQKMKPAYASFINTWDKSVYNFTGKVEPYQEGYFKLLNTENSLAGIKPKKKVFKGNIVLLVNEANSSGTFLMAKIAKYNKLATLVGTETGGDNRGINAGVIGFMRLPNSKIEVDIPLIGTYYNEGNPDGVQPDIKVQVSPMPFLYEKDFYLNAALEYINKK